MLDSVLLRYHISVGFTRWPKKLRLQKKILSGNFSVICQTNSPFLRKLERKYLEQQRTVHERSILTPVVFGFCTYGLGSRHEELSASTFCRRKWTSSYSEFIAIWRYVEILYDLQNFSGYNQKTWFQQDGVTSHTSNTSLPRVGEFLSGKLNSRRLDIHWHPRSPDLNLIDFSYEVMLKLKFTQIYRLPWGIWKKLSVTKWKSWLCPPAEPS